MKEANEKTKELYEEPEVQIISFDETDVICASGCGGKSDHQTNEDRW